eukprot:COSAG02_NODE_4045_length_5865_cov_5.416233_6_plen_113_part_00
MSICLAFLLDELLGRIVAVRLRVLLHELLVHLLHTFGTCVVTKSWRCKKQSLINESIELLTEKAQQCDPVADEDNDDDNGEVDSGADEDNDDDDGEVDSGADEDSERDDTIG